jgi:DNA-binding NtrC family response regulator
MSRILIVDDEPAIGWSLREMLGDEGHVVELAGSVEAALEACARFTPEMLLLDVRLPGRDGLSALSDFHRVTAGAPIVVMTAFGDLETAVRALQAGAFDYLVKPFHLEQAAHVVTRALADRCREEGPAGQPTAATLSQPLLVGRSAALQTVFKQIALVAGSDLPVLITGATGTGKELAARALHAHGQRSDRPLVTAHLAALTSSLIESELFGHVRGGFTGATADRVGLFERADRGTIFLDEIGEASPEVQVKLLRVLEAGEIAPVGAASARRVDVRIIAATNRDLSAAVAAGGFRADLYHRLCGFPIAMPSLAERLDDIPLLVEHFLARQGQQNEPVYQATPAFLEALQRRPWPGNIRELKHAVDHAAVLARGRLLEPEHLPPPPIDWWEPTQRSAVPEGPSPDDAESRLVRAVNAWLSSHWNDTATGGLRDRLMGLIDATLAREAMARTGGNRTAAARHLGVDRATLRGKLAGEFSTRTAD